MNFDSLEQLLSTQRAIRHFSDRPLDDATIERVLRAATYAPSSHNSQPWRFIVVRDVDTKEQLGVIFDELGAAIPGGPPARTPWRDVPALIVACSKEAPGDEAGAAGLAASIYPAVQNLLIAAHAIGLGANLTTRWKAREPEAQKILGLPPGVVLHAIVPIGWPDRRYGKSKRRPVGEVAYRERYGTSWR